MDITLKVENREGAVLAQSIGADEVTLIYEPEYIPGDRVVVECGEPGAFLVLQLEDTIAPALVYLAGTRFFLEIPFEEKRVSYSPRSFTGGLHVLHARAASAHEISARRNLAFNPLDSHANASLFPHASANVETRGEAVFAARNAIDGVKSGENHGFWPYQSWGINRDPNAEIMIDFGRDVRIDTAVIYLRADFPHDAWWEHVTLEFSDGSSLGVPLEKTGRGQTASFDARTVRWARMHSLIKADDPSPFPALIQIEFHGSDIVGD